MLALERVLEQGELIPAVGRVDHDRRAMIGVAGND
jgi:hypothetical protein